MEKDNNKTEFYDRLRLQLEGDTSWPAPYLYKFIVPSSLEKIAEIEAVFNDLDAIIKTKDSSKGKYTSLSVMVTMKSSNAVIEKYLKVSKIEGVISL